MIDPAIPRRGPRTRTEEKQFAAQVLIPLFACFASLVSISDYEQPAVIKVVLGLLILLSPVIWWRRWTGSPSAIAAEAIMAILCTVSGLVLYTLTVASIAWILVRPPTGPMAAEGALFGLAIGGFGVLTGIWLTVSPFALDSSFYLKSTRDWARRALPILFVAATVLGVLMGPNLESLFAPYLYPDQGLQERALVDQYLMNDPAEHLSASNTSLLLSTPRSGLLKRNNPSEPGKLFLDFGA